MTRVRILIYAAAIVGATCVEAANAADPRYPDWPCAQAKVPELSVAAVWDGPAIDTARGAWTNDPKIRDLAARPAARRTPVEEAQKAAVDFVTGDDGDKGEKAKQLFAGLFDALNQQRAEVMDGIDRIAQKEKEL